VQHWVVANQAAMRTLPTAFVSVCLSIRDQRAATRRELDQVIERFCTQTGWRPTVAKAVAGALLYTHYNWLVRLMMKQIVRRAGGDTDTSRDYEYTDWADLRSFVLDFAARVGTSSERHVA
jgi:menaquinone-dependent protoporphyrinogen oxidase